MATGFDQKGNLFTELTQSRFVLVFLCRDTASGPPSVILHKEGKPLKITFQDLSTKLERKQVKTIAYQ